MIHSDESGSRVHPSRVRWVREAATDLSGRYVLYWVQVNQRARLNPAFEFAVEQADALRLPLVVYQGLRPDTPAANDRIHTFILEGARDLARELEPRGVRFLFHLERRRGAAGGVLVALARDAALVVTDHFPVFIVPGQTRALARQIDRPFAAVEASCIVPAALFPRAEVAARTLRPKLQRLLPDHLVPRDEIAPQRPSTVLDVPFPFPGRGIDADEACWLDMAAAGSDEIAEWVASCTIDHLIEPVSAFPGGSAAARARLEEFAATKLSGYDEARDDPARDGTSSLSPYLHFGQVSSLEAALAALGFRGAPSAGDAHDVRGAVVEVLSQPKGALGAFLEQLVVRRELAFNFCENEPRHATIEALPDWARRTLDDHALDLRRRTYDREALEFSESDDAVWNAAQEELRERGVIHNRLRMLWGKKILEWSRTPDEAVALMIDLHDRYALDGRDPNTYANILWCLGLHDRPFGPARAVTGAVRRMSSEVARRSFDLDAYLARIRKPVGARTA